MIIEGCFSSYLHVSNVSYHILIMFHLLILSYTYNNFIYSFIFGYKSRKGHLFYLYDIQYFMGNLQLQTKVTVHHLQRINRRHYSWLRLANIVSMSRRVKFVQTCVLILNPNKTIICENVAPKKIQKYNSLVRNDLNQR